MSQRVNKFHHLTRNLTQQFADIENTITELSACARQFSKMYKLSDNKQFSHLYEDIQETFSRWAKVQRQTADSVAINLAVFHSFPIQHIMSLRNLESAKIQHQSCYEKAVFNLEKKKEKAFRSKDITKWELNIEDIKRGKELLDNKKQAYKAMFYQDQDELRLLKDTYHFYINQCYREIRRVNRYDMMSTHINYIKL